MALGVLVNFATSAVEIGGLPTWVTWTAIVVLTFAGAVLAARAARIRPDVMPPLDAKIETLRRSLADSSNLIREINAEFELQAAEAERIKAEADQNQRLAELSRDQAEAVRELVESVQGRAAKLGGRQQWLFFLAGLLAAVPLGVAGNFAFEFVKAWLAS